VLVMSLALVPQGWIPATPEGIDAEDEEEMAFAYLAHLAVLAPG